MTANTKKRRLSLAPRRLAFEQLRAEDSLVLYGWTRRSMTDQKRAEEMREVYESLGFEVVLRRPEPWQFDPRCGDCRDHACSGDVVIYTKRR